MKRVILATFGSLGDLHPFLGIAHELRRRGHHPVIATSKFYGDYVRAEGLEFSPLRPDLPADNAALMAKVMSPSNGAEFLTRRMLLPSIQGMYEDLLATCRAADLLVTQELVFAAPTVVERTGIPWVSAALAPFSYFSKDAPPVFNPVAWSANLGTFGKAIRNACLGIGRWQTRRWFAPVDQFRKNLGLGPAGNLHFEAKHSPAKSLALFSRHFSTPDADWPAQTSQPGFVFHDGVAQRPMSKELSEFLDAGSPPVVFTLGSACVHSPGAFFEQSAVAAKQLGLRAVLLLGNNPAPSTHSPEIFCAGYAPYSEIFPRAALVVHQGGIGTCAQGLRAGKPTLVLPHAYDQPDNASRLRRLGISKTLPLNGYKAGRVAKEIESLLADTTALSRATAIGEKIRTEKGAQAAVGDLENF